MTYLTVVIPFLNEREEVENTLASVCTTVYDSIDVILINDCSDDGYNYKRIASKYKVRYIENDRRLGVAASRDLGVNLCKTPYVLFLDAHMRFYDSSWVMAIVTELEKDDRVPLCCQTKFLYKDVGRGERTIGRKYFKGFRLENGVFAPDHVV